MGELMRPAPRRSLPEHVVALARWIGVGRIVAVAVSVVAVGAGSFWLLRSPDAGAGASGASTPPVSATIGAPAAGPEATEATEVTATSPPTSTAPAPVVVHVAGAVVSAGVYRLPGGSRIGEAVDAAGGPAADAVLDAVNLAALLVDGQQIYVPHTGEAAGPAPPQASGATSTVAAQPIDLNAATEEELLALPGVGPVTAAAIVRHRDESGPFTSVDQLLDVPGIGPARLASLAGLVRV
jgi:competence protein ComEA